jgi:hypothetical protein
VKDLGKNEAIRILRQEVGFGCPICRSPFLTWHHFDPPWHVEQHWRSEGIIALCPLCHGNADAKGSQPGAYSIPELRAMKHSAQSIDTVRAHMPTWQNKEHLLVRIGGCYTDTSGPIISINGVAQLRVKRAENDLLLLSFELRNANDEVIVSMEDNVFTAYPGNIHDMVIAPKSTSVKVWLGKDDVGLEFSFKRIMREDLAAVMAADLGRVKPEIQRIHSEAFARARHALQNLPPEILQAIEKDASTPFSPDPSIAEGMPEEIRRTFLTEDKVAWSVERWMKDNIEEGEPIPFLNVEQMALWFHGNRWVIKDGIANFIRYSACFESPGGFVNLGCPCPACTTDPNR